MNRGQICDVFPLHVRDIQALVVDSNIGYYSSVGLTHFTLENITMSIADAGLSFFVATMVFGILKYFFALGLLFVAVFINAIASKKDK
jgi:hypothetical protein